ncbi:nuclear transport factor 2 family protein [Flavobacterium sp.]|uniref:nuclear transport factor 2 family protein n=1 Tax=Flavobacterium sp. TaxID=239 RepID=UPI0037507180
MKKLLSIILFVSSLTQAQTRETAKIKSILDNWHKAAAEAKFDTYFGMMSEESIFIGTDATENWNKKDFMAFAKPFFDKGKAWSFTALERHVYFDKSGKIAWFDELLNTQMKICRGSGVLEKIKGEWKIKHYVLSMTIPNDSTNEVIKIKEIIENPIIDKLKK